MVQEKGKYTGLYTVITGASSGIGYETAKAFAERGKNTLSAASERNAEFVADEKTFYTALLSNLT